MSEKTEEVIHPLYLKEIVFKRNYELLTIPQEKNNDMIYYGETISNESGNRGIDIGNINLNDKKVLEIVYNIIDFKSLHHYLENNIRDNLKITIDRIFNYSWKTFYENYKENLEYIGKSYLLYFKKFNIKFNEQNINKVLFSIKKKNNIENIHKYIITSIN